MKITGHIHEITNLGQFALSFITNPKSPKAGTFKNAPNIRIHLGSMLEGISPGFFPGFSVEATSGADGKFTMNIADSQKAVLAINNQVYFTAYKRVGSINVLGNSFPVFEPVYRTQLFDISKFDSSKKLDFYFAPMQVTNASGITQSQIDDQIKQSKAKFKDLEKLGATIEEGKVSVRGSGRGADIKFNIDLSGSTSFDLSRFIKGKVKDMDIDLPGPDFIVGICVSKDDIEKEIAEGISKLMVQVNAGIEKELINQMATATGQPAKLVAGIFKTTASVTFSKLDFPVVDHKKIKVPVVNTFITIDVRAVVPKVSVGFPRIIS